MTDGPRPRKSERQPECGEDQRTEATMNGEGGEEEEEEQQEEEEEQEEE
jgi:hypothetical protein